MMSSAPPKKNSLTRYIEHVLSFSDIEVRKYSDSIGIRIHGRNLTFEALSKLSKAFNTTLINISAEHDGPGCDSCGYGEETYVTLTLHKAEIPSYISLKK